MNDLTVPRRRIKIFLYVLVRDLEFSIDPSIEIEKKVKCVRPSLPAQPSAITDTRPVHSVLTRPSVKSEPHRGNQMPLYIRRVSPLDDGCEGVRI